MGPFFVPETVSKSRSETSFKNEFSPSFSLYNKTGWVSRKNFGNKRGQNGNNIRQIGNYIMRNGNNIRHDGNKPRSTHVLFLAICLVFIYHSKVAVSSYK